MNVGETKKTRSTLRQRILAFVGGLILLSLLGSTMSLYRITEVDRLLDAINRVSVPLGRLFTQMQSDAEVLNRELERSLGYSHWKDSHWRPRPIPRWIEDVLESEIERAKALVKNESNWASPETRLHWQEWANNISQGLASLRTEAHRLYTALEQKDEVAAAQIYPRWTASMEEWRRQLQSGASEYERTMRQTFSLAESRVAELRTGLEIVLGVVVLLSLLLLWLGERALRPLAQLTTLAREIARRGLRKEDKAVLPEIHFSRQDEVSQLAREFHHMAIALLEREKTVDMQKNRLAEQYRLLRNMGELNENVLDSIKSVLIVTDLSGKITQCNPVAARWLGAASEQVIGSQLTSWASKVQAIPAHLLERVQRSGEVCRIEPTQIEGKIYGGQVMPLRHATGTAGATIAGAIVVLDDLTDELDLQERLRRAENLAAVGRLSAQVAHEVRNPLHSIGLEAEMATEAASAIGDIPVRTSLKQSLQSILGAVDRLEKITENYLKLSRFSVGDKREIDLGEVLEAVLATYASVCEVQCVRIDWKREKRAILKIAGDRDLLELVFGNLLRNALQALEGVVEPKILWTMGSAESGRVWIRIEDNGPGIPDEIKSKLFTPFVTTRAQGTGLGLSFVKKVIEDHGGSISYIESAGDSSLRGACFEMVFPSVVRMETDKTQEVPRLG